MFFLTNVFTKLKVTNTLSVVYGISRILYNLDIQVYKVHIKLITLITSSYVQNLTFDYFKLRLYQKHSINSARAPFNHNSAFILSLEYIE
jgi:hypothetical protein